MRSFTYKVTDDNGIHARPAGIVVSAAKQFSSAIKASCNEKSADCKKLFSLMNLEASKGDVLTFTIEGGDEEYAAISIKKAMEEAGL